MLVKDSFFLGTLPQLGTVRNLVGALMRSLHLFG